MLLFFSVNLEAVANVELLQVPISDLFVCSRGEDCDIVVVVLKLLLFLQGLFSLL